MTATVNHNPIFSHDIDANGVPVSPYAIRVERDGKSYVLNYAVDETPKGDIKLMKPSESREFYEGIGMTRKPAPKRTPARKPQPKPEPQPQPATPKPTDDALVAELRAEIDRLMRVDEETRARLHDMSATYQQEQKRFTEEKRALRQRIAELEAANVTAQPEPQPAIVPDRTSDTATVSAYLTARNIAHTVKGTYSVWVFDLTNTSADDLAAIGFVWSAKKQGYYHVSSTVRAA